MSGMVRATVKVIATLLLAVSVFVNYADAEKTGIVAWTQSSYTVLVDDPIAVSDSLVSQAGRLGGYFSYRDNVSVRFKIPASKTGEFINLIKEHGEIVASTYDATDIRSRLESERTLLKTREEVFERYLDVLENANTEKLVYVENEVSRLVREIELAKGKIRFLEHQAKFSQIDIWFSFRDRSAPIKSAKSSFEWLNQVSLPSLLGKFKYVTE